MTDLRSRLAAGDTVYGTFLGLGCALAAEACALAGFDWLLADLEHGGGRRGLVRDGAFVKIGRMTRHDSSGFQCEPHYRAAAGGLFTAPSATPVIISKSARPTDPLGVSTLSIVARLGARSLSTTDRA